MKENEFDELALQYRCERCLAGVGTWCRTLTGAKATALHQCRLSPLYSAFGAGYQEHQEQASLSVAVRPA